jgi:hypothetical protein
MSMTDYDALVVAWKAAGSPKLPASPLTDLDAA